jgi:hypothetical protein
MLKSMRREFLVVITAATLLSRLASAQSAGVVVSGIVYDSIAHAPLAGAAVQLAAEHFGRNVTSDSLGRFTFSDVPDGRYMLGFFHPMLDSLGLDAPVREISVMGHQPLRVDVAIPSPARYRAAVCGAKSDSGAVLIGVVRDARDGAPATDVNVTAEWLELSIGPGGVVRHVPRIATKTGGNGWFALCNVPSPGTLTMAATRGADSTDVVEIQVPREAVVRRELYLGAARTVVIGDTTKRTDSLAAPARRLHVGDGRVSGVVVTALGGQPLANAQVGIAGGPQTHANERGEWTLVDAPAGTRMLEVRAVGYYPERRRVDVVASAPPIRVALATLKSVLDTVKVTARRNGSLNMADFQERARTGPGRYLTAADIARRQPIVTSDIFRNVPGVTINGARGSINDSIIVRGALGPCKASIYIDGRLMPSPFTTDDLDAYVRPTEIKGVEVYAGIGAPPQFQEDMGSCGSIVIWTR